MNPPFQGLSSPGKANHSISQHDELFAGSRIVQKNRCIWFLPKYNRSTLYIRGVRCGIAAALVKTRIGLVPARTDSYPAHRGLPSAVAKELHFSSGLICVSLTANAEPGLYVQDLGEFSGLLVGPPIPCCCCAVVFLQTGQHLVINARYSGHV